MYHNQHKEGIYICECQNNKLKPSKYIDAKDGQKQWFPHWNELQNASSDPFDYIIYKPEKHLSDKLARVKNQKPLKGNIQCKDQVIVSKLKSQALPIIKIIEEKRKIMIKKICFKFIEEADTGIFYFIGVSEEFTVLKANVVNP